MEYLVGLFFIFVHVGLDVVGVEGLEVYGGYSIS